MPKFAHFYPIWAACCDLATAVCIQIFSTKYNCETFVTVTERFLNQVPKT